MARIARLAFLFGLRPYVSAFVRAAAQERTIRDVRQDAGSGVQVGRKRAAWGPVWGFLRDVEGLRDDESPLWWLGG
jgi:hypothetical protein